MKTKPLVSEIIVTFNSLDTISTCLDCLLKETYFNREIIVFDNASTDETPQFITNHYPNIQLIKGNENIGFGGGNNLAAEQAQGKYLAFINDDAFVSKDWLFPLIQYLENNPSVGCISPEILCKENENVILCDGNNIHLSGIAYTNNRGKAPIADKIFEVGSISGAAFIINRDLFIEMGGFESDYFLYYEDIDLCLRLRLQGKKCIVRTSSKVFHNCESRFGLDKVFYLERNRYLSIFSLMHPAMILVMLPSLFVFEIISWGYVILRGKEAIQKKMDAWKEVFKSGAWIQNRRKRYTKPNKNFWFVLKSFSPCINLNYVNNNSMVGYVSRIIGFFTAAPLYYGAIFVEKTIFTIVELFLKIKNRKSGMGGGKVAS